MPDFERKFLVVDRSEAHAASLEALSAHVAELVANGDEAALADAMLNMIDLVSAILSTDPDTLTETFGETSLDGIASWAVTALGDIADTLSRFPDLLAEAGTEEIGGLQAALAGGLNELFAPNQMFGSGGRINGDDATAAAQTALSAALTAARQDVPKTPDKASDEEPHVVHVTNTDILETAGKEVCSDGAPVDFGTCEIYHVEGGNTPPETDDPEEEDMIWFEETTIDAWGDEVTSGEWVALADVTDADDQPEPDETPPASTDPAPSNGDGTTQGDDAEDTDTTPTPETEGQDLPKDGEDGGPPPDDLDKGPTYGLTQPDITANKNEGAPPADDGLAPLIMTDPDHDRIEFTLTINGPTYGLTQPSPVSDPSGHAGSVPTGPSDGQVMQVYDAAFVPVYVDDLF